MKKLKIKIKGLLVVKIAKLRKEIRTYKERIAQDVLEKQEFIDKITLLENDIRDLLFKLSKEDRTLWLKERGIKNARYNNQKKRTKK